MNRVLVIGASGQLGSIILKQLLEQSFHCVVFLRKSSLFTPPNSNLIEIVNGDLADFPSVLKACHGINQVITTASSIIPRQGDIFGKEEIKNHQNLIKACQYHKIEHLIYISAFSSPHILSVPEFQVKRQIEEIIVSSAIPYTIFRCAAFMDIYFSVMGSKSVLNGVLHPTLLRGFWLTKLYSKLTTGLIENHGIALIPGRGDTKHPFICINDVATYMVKALSIPAAKNSTIELGGDKAISWNTVIDIYADLLDKKITRIKIPSFVFRSIRIVLKPLSPAGENLMSVLFLLSSYNVKTDMSSRNKEFGLHLTDTRQFLIEKLGRKNSSDKN